MIVQLAITCVAMSTPLFERRLTGSMALLLDSLGACAPYLPTSPHISPHLPTSPHCSTPSVHAPAGFVREAGGRASSHSSAPPPSPWTGFDFSGAYTMVNLGLLSAEAGGWALLMSSTFWVAACLLLVRPPAGRRFKGACV